MSTEEKPQFESIILQAYYFAEGGFWSMAANGYLQDDSADDPEILELDPSWLPGSYTADEVQDELRMIGKLFISDRDVQRGVSLQLEGTEFEFLQAEKDVCQSRE